MTNFAVTARLLRMTAKLQFKLPVGLSYAVRAEGSPDLKTPGSMDRR
jgi:hypothetical protein